MLVRLSTLIQWNGEPIDNVRYPPNIEDLWSDAELAAIDLARPAKMTIPAGKVATGSPRIEVVDGWPTIVYDLADAPTRWFVSRLVIVDRLAGAGKLNDALDAIENDRYTKARWDAATEIASDDPTALALCAALGLDPAVILAKE